MQNIVSGQIIEIGDNVSPWTTRHTGDFIVNGVKLRLANGEVFWMKQASALMEVGSIMRHAAETGDVAELWLAGSVEKPHVYAIRATGEAFYSAGYANRRLQAAAGLFVLGIPMILLFGLGFGGMILGLVLGARSLKYRPRYSRKQFDVGCPAVLPSSTRSPLLRFVPRGRHALQ